MKAYIIVTVYLLAACQNNPEETFRVQAQQQMEDKVAEVVQQLRNDCDSSLLQLAKFKADSLRQRYKMNRYSRKSDLLRRVPAKGNKSRPKI